MGACWRVIPIPCHFSPLGASHLLPFCASRRCKNPVLVITQFGGFGSRGENDERRQNKKRKVNSMTAVKETVRGGGVIPLLAALPFRIAVESSDNEPLFSYDPLSQQT